MKTDIHPDYVESHVTCTWWQRVHHPFYLARDPV